MDAAAIDFGQAWAAEPADEETVDEEKEMPKDTSSAPCTVW